MSRMQKDDFWVEEGEDDPRDLRFQPADPASAKTLTAAQVESFNRDGFIPAVPVFDADEVRRIRAYFDGLIEAVVSADDLRNSYSINHYQMVCAGIYDLVLTDRILDCVTDLIGGDVISWGTQVFCKLAGDDKDIPLHQDASYWPFTPTKSVTAWLAIDAVDAENAAMTFVPGSHRLGPVAHEQLDLDGTRVLSRGAADPDQYGERFVNAMPAGSMSLHTDLLLHGSPPNLSDRRRAALTIRYTASEVKVLPGWESWTKPAMHCRGDARAWRGWRRPDGEHPEKMAGFWGVFDGNPPNPG